MRKEALKISILLVLILGFLFWEIIETYTFITFFYEKMIALAWLLTGVYFVIENDTTLSRIFATIALNNILDELFFNPLIFGINEKILITLIIIMSYFNYKNNPKKCQTDIQN